MRAHLSGIPAAWFWLVKVVAVWPKAVKRDEYKVVLPCGHPLAERERIDIHELDGLPFLLLEHGGKTEVTELLEKSGVHPKIRFTTWEDYAIMAMAERGLGIGILPELILQRIPYRIEIRPLAQPYYRQIGLAMKDRRRLSPAAQSFVSYLKVLSRIMRKIVCRLRLSEVSRQ